MHPKLASSSCKIYSLVCLAWKPIISSRCIPRVLSQGLAGGAGCWQAGKPCLLVCMEERGTGWAGACGWQLDRPAGSEESGGGGARGAPMFTALLTSQMLSRSWSWLDVAFEKKEGRQLGFYFENPFA